MIGPNGRRGRTAAATVFVVALTVRLLYALTLGAGNPQLSSDGMVYHQIAVNLVTRGIFSEYDPPEQGEFPYASRPPLTPLVLAATYSLTGPDLRAAQIVLALVGAGTGAVDHSQRDAVRRARAGHPPDRLRAL